MSSSPKEEVRKRSPSVKKPRGFKVIATAMGFKTKKPSSIPDTEDPPHHLTLPRIASSPDKLSQRPQIHAASSFSGEKIEYGKPAVFRSLNSPASQKFSSSLIHSEPADSHQNYPHRGSEKLKFRESPGNLQREEITRELVRNDNHGRPLRSLKVLPEDRCAEQDYSSTSCRSWPRRMTESDIIRRPPILADIAPATSSSGTPSIGAVHKISIPRIGSPPSAPPKQKLPPPPVFGENTVECKKMTIPDMISSFNSSPLSSASPTREASNRFEDPTPGRLAKCEEISRLCHMPYDSSQQPIISTPLKKALSQQSLRKHSQSSSTSILTSPTESKSRRGQHPLRRLETPTRDHSAPSFFNNVPGPGSTSISDGKRVGTGLNLIPGRKRLFSGSNSFRPLTSRSIVSDDDNRSIASIRSDSHQNAGAPIFKSWTSPSSNLPTPGSPPPSDQVTRRTSDVPSSYNGLVNEYAPQQILSPEEMAQLEASVEDSHSQPRQQHSFASLSVSVLNSSGNVIDADGGIYPRSRSHRIGESSGLPGVASGENRSHNERFTVPQKHPCRPSTSPAETRLHTLDPFISHKRFIPVTTSLPPPPRQPSSRPLFVGSSTLHRQEKSIDHRAVIRKPSFLNIDDDSEESDIDEHLEGRFESSFLDLARESLDNSKTENK